MSVSPSVELRSSCSWRHPGPIFTTDVPSHSFLYFPWSPRGPAPWSLHVGPYTWGPARACQLLLRSHVSNFSPPPLSCLSHSILLLQPERAVHSQGLMGLDWVYPDNPGGLSSWKIHDINHTCKACFCHVRRHIHVFQGWGRGHGGGHAGHYSIICGQGKRNFLKEMSTERRRLIKDNSEQMATCWLVILQSSQGTHRPILLTSLLVLKRCCMRQWVKNTRGYIGFTPLVLLKRNLRRGVASWPSSHKH